MWGVGWLRLFLGIEHIRDMHFEDVIGLKLEKLMKPWGKDQTTEKIFKNEIYVRDNESGQTVILDGTEVAI